jgi:TRAP-type C4-dicarboxylate transport system permease small subunit
MNKLLSYWQSAEKVNTRINQVANIISALVIFLIMLYITSDVTGRYAFSNPLPGTFEIVEMLMVFVVFFGLAYTQMLHSHIRIVLLFRYFSPRTRLFIEIFTNIAFFAIFFFILWESTNKAILSTVNGEFVAGLINVPSWPSRWAVSVGAFLVCLRLTFETVDLVLKGLNKRWTQQLQP